MSEATGPNNSKPPEQARGWLFYVGAGALLFAMAVEAVAVLGRHLGWPLPGSIELMQAAILLASSAAMVSATLAGKHATVRLLIDRVSPRTRVTMIRIHAVICALFFVTLAAGSIWIFLDLRDGHEESEVLHIPFAPLRIVSILAVLGVALAFLRRAAEKARP